MWGRIYIYSWAESLGASPAKCGRVVGLLNVRWLCFLPLPSNTFRVAGISEARWHRYLFQRHVKDILNWRERLNEGNPEGFSDRVNWLLRHKVFPERGAEDDTEFAGGGYGDGTPPPEPLAPKLDRGGVSMLRQLHHEHGQEWRRQKRRNCSRPARAPTPRRPLCR